jgi:hypothetical protein
MLRILIVIAALALASCVSVPTKQYRGDDLPISELAVIYTKDIRMQKINGNTLGIGKDAGEYHLLPGDYELCFIFSDGTAWFKRPVYSVELEAGKTYILKGFTPPAGGWTFTFIENNSKSEVGHIERWETNW